MADEKPSLHIDTDWKKQAQEEKRRLVEQEAAKKAPAPPAAPAPAPGVTTSVPDAPSPGASATAASSRATGRPRERGQAPEANFPTLVQSILTQVLFYLGDLTPRGVEPQLNLDMAKYNIDLLGVIEEKTKNNLTQDEQKLLDAALYEGRMRYVSIASQYATV